MEVTKSQREFPCSWWAALSHAQLSGRAIMRFDTTQGKQGFRQPAVSLAHGSRDGVTQ